LIKKVSTTYREVVGVELGVGKSLPSLSLPGKVSVSRTALEGGVLRRRLSAEPRALTPVRDDPLLLLLSEKQMKRDKKRLRRTLKRPRRELRAGAVSILPLLLLLWCLRQLLFLSGGRRTDVEGRSRVDCTAAAAAHAADGVGAPWSIAAQVRLRVGKVIDVGTVSWGWRHCHCNNKQETR
jgi:hypothetical protein